ncbi:MAG: glycosyltransferase [Chthoniobacterales bacterium]|jgi:colanic acid/amylovoran biosynthesis glycosyltransferase
METPTVSVFCATFLKPEMWHVYRQVVGPTGVRITVHAFKRENADRFPYPDLFLVPRSPYRWVRRVWHVQIRHSPQLALPSECRGLLHSLIKQKSDVVHIYFGNNGIFWLPFIRRSPVPVIVSFHGADVQVGLSSSVADLRLRELFQRAALVLARSESLAEALKERGCPPDKVEVHRTGIPLELYSVHHRPRPPGDAWRLVQACRLVEKKGLGVTLRAFARFQKQFPAATLTIAGDGPLRHQLEAQRNQLGITSNVIFTGFLDAPALAQLFFSSDIFVHPSELTSEGNREGVPNSLLEAMATGLPSVATRHGGIPEAISDRVSGLLVDEADPEALFRALEELARDDRLRASISEKGAEVVANKFNHTEQIKKLESTYLRVIKAAARLQRDDR